MLLFLIACLVVAVAADCECGYTATIGTSASSLSSYLFTDLLESDFLHIANITQDTDWKPQNFTVTAAAGRGPYGMNHTVKNVVANGIPDINNWTGPGILGGDPGLQLTVSGGVPSDGYVDTAEMDSVRTDMLWGSYRASMKLSPIAGTCSAFFWYFNDSQEIDMEFLSSQFNLQNKSFPVNLVLQSLKSVQANFNAMDAGTYAVANLPFNPTTGYHEYRIDFIAGTVIFYADGQILATMDNPAVPTSAGHLILTNWSNGNNLWSSGPPVQNSTISVSYVKAYFNSSLPARQSDWTKRCKNAAVQGSICQIPDQKSSPDPNIAAGNDTAANTYFFSDHPMEVVNQTVYKKSDAFVRMDDGTRSAVLLLVVALVAVLL
ncbi:glycoside hydrolase family 16 protein [Halenospora varia]|nr:glycoside hydrolase family 16 protein [Halenospora varia]